MKIVLLNPPGDKLYVRSYYCGSTSKANYLFQPLDLLILSGILYKEHEIAVIDCIAERLNEKEAIERISVYKPEIVVCIVSIVSWKLDLNFLYQLKQQSPHLIIIVNGDVFFENPEDKIQKNSCIDAIVFDFISSDVVYYLKNEEDKISNMIYRKKDNIIFKRIIPTKIDRTFSIPIPRHELFLNKNYRFPFVKHYPFTTVLTNFGCPFQCLFCIANTLGFKYRKAEEVVEELRYISRLGIKEIFFEDMSFGIPRDNTINLCKIILLENLKFSWTCFSRVDLLDYELLSLMKQTGCHTIMFGVESASEKILEIYRKGYTKKQVIDAFKMCRKMGIKTVATFILGLPDDDMESCLETIKFSKEIDCDYASFNIAVPRPGTELRKMAIKEGLIRQEDIIFDHSGQSVYTFSKYLSKEELGRLRKKAIKEFYLRPSYILRQLTRAKSLTEFIEHIREFSWLILNTI